MKLTIILMTAAFLQVHATGVSQTVTYNGVNVPLEKVFDAVKNQTGYAFFYHEEVLRNAKPVTVNVENLPIESFLEKIMDGQMLKYKIESKNVIISKRTTADLSPRLPLPPPPITVKGRVVNEKGDAVIASIIIKGSNKGTTSDIDGNFTINNVDGNAILIISGVSIETQEIPVSNRTSIIIRSITKINAEEEIVIRTDYFGSTKRKSTMNISKVDGKDIENQPVTTLMNAIVGRVPGLDITPRNGFPGSASLIQIRGRNSLSQTGAYPLYVIDGVQIESRPLQGVASAGIDPLNGISPSNIESIEVLKDAAATAIYGSRGANGVIRITTKRAFKQAGRTNLDFNAYAGIGELSKKVQLLNREQYLQMRYEAYKNAGSDPDVFSAHDLFAWDTLRTTDWQDVLLGGTANITDIQGGLSGGNELTTYRIGGGYHKETTIYPGEFSYQRATSDFSFHHMSEDRKLEISAGMNYGWIKNRTYSSGQLVTLALSLPPIAPKLYNEDGTLNWEMFSYTPDYKAETWINPLSSLLYQNNNVSNTLVSNASVSYELFTGLKLKTALSLSNISNDEDTRSPIAAEPPSSRIYSTGQMTFNRNLRNSLLIEPQLIYNKALNKHRFNAVVGTSWQQIHSLYKSEEGRDYPSDALLGSILGAKTIVTRADDNNQYKYASVYAHIGYDFKSKYLIDLTGRRDGSSRFGPGKRYGNFGAVGLAWIFSEEDFIQKNLSFISFGKLRGSHGVTGNDQIGDYQYLNTYSIFADPAGYQDGISLIPTALYNADFRWETTKKTEVAIELGFIKNRIMVDAAWFKNISSNQLVDFPLGATAGFPSVLSNFDAVIENTGFELDLTTKNISNKNFKWTTTFNLTIPQNKLVKFDGIEGSPYTTIYKVGEPLSIRRLYTYKGVNSETGVYEIVDIDENGSFNTNDRKFMSPLGRKSYAGFINTFGFKNIDLSFLVQLSDNPLSGYLLSNMPGTAYNHPVEVLERWQKPGDDKRYQKFLPSPNSAYNRATSSNYNTTDASFIRLKTLSIGYNFSSKRMKKINLKESRIYLQGQNLFTVTDYKGWDPETGYSMPPLRMLTIGAQIRL